MTRISILGLNYPPEPTGISPYTGGLALGLQSTPGFEVRVFAAHPHYPEWKFRGRQPWTSEERLEGVRVTRLLHYLPGKPKGVRRLISELSFGLRLVFSPWGRPDVVVMVSPALFATALAVLRARLTPKRPTIVVWVQDLYGRGMTETGQGGRHAAEIVARIESATLRASDGVAVIHQGFADWVVNEIGVEIDRVRVIPNWSHVDEFVNGVDDLQEVRGRYGWNPTETVVLHAGNMGDKQGLENVVNAARLADDQQLPVRFVLMGNGSEREALRASAVGIERITFLDTVDDSAFASTIAAADVLLVNEKPGVASMAVPSKLTSYFSTGRPVLAAIDPGGLTAIELVASGAGIQVPSGSPQQLLDAALQLRDEPGLAVTLGASGLRYRRRALDENTIVSGFGQWLRDGSQARPEVNIRVL